MVDQHGRAPGHDVTFADALGPAANTEQGRLLRRIIDYTLERTA